MDTSTYYQTPPVYENSTKPPRPWKIIGIIAGAVVLIVIIIFGGLWIGNRRESAEREAAMALAEQELAAALAGCENERKPEACQAALIETVAQNSAAAEICLELDGSAMVSCVWKVARESFDAEACDLIEEEKTKTECADSVYRALATRDLDISWCESILSDINRERCINTLSEQIAETKGCSGTGIDQAICDRQTALAAAIASDDPDRCAALTNDDDKVDCLDTVGSGDRDHDGLGASLEVSLGTSDTNLDSDGDGLSDANEYNLYKTDPAKADTDGDSYNDKQELDGGYNPLGPGKL